MSKEKSALINVGVPVDVNDKFQAWCDRRRAVKRDVLSAIIERFLKLPAPVQTAFIDTVDEGMEAYYATALRNLADEVMTVDVGVVRSKGSKKSNPPGAHSGNAADPVQGRR